MNTTVPTTTAAAPPAVQATTAQASEGPDEDRKVDIVCARICQVRPNPNGTKDVYLVPKRVNGVDAAMATKLLKLLRETGTNRAFVGAAGETSFRSSSEIKRVARSLGLTPSVLVMM
jgi:hypothetical protein